MDVDDLYGLPLERFVSERGALARALRADGHREQAASVASLRKPSIAAWAVNQLVRTQGKALDELFDAGDALRRAQEDVVSGRGDGHALRAAADRERAAVDLLVAAARGLLSSEGHELGAAIVERVADTIHAAALDDEARGQVRAGRLERELRHVGLGIGAGADALPLPRPPKRLTPTARTGVERRATPPAGRAGDEPPPRSSEHRERLAEARAAARALERNRVQARRAARAAEAETRRLADRAARALEVAQERRERAAQALSDAEDGLATARATAQAAADAHRRAHEQLERTGAPSGN